MSNVIKNSEIAEHFKEKGISFTLSSRGIRKDIDILDYLKIFFMYVPFENIDSVFGFSTEFSPLYGGRGFSKTFAMTPAHVNTLEEKGIAISLTLTNHLFDEKNYLESYPLLQRHHTKGNSIVCVNDELVLRIRKDFPNYELKASLIKNLNTYEKVSTALELYDSVVIPMDMNDDDKFLESLPSKERIVLFANANCAYNCTARICYNTISHDMTGKRTAAMHNCSQDMIPRLDMGHVFFNVKKLHAMGYTRFKLVPNLTDTALQMARKFSHAKNYYLDTIKVSKPIYQLYSYPKSGRTWLRFMIANYFNTAYELGLSLDLHSMFTLLPNDGDDQSKGLSAYDFADDTRFPAIISTHNMPQAPQIKKSPVILLMRLVYDVVVSDYFQHTERLERYKGDISAFIREEKGSLHRYCTYLNTWATLLADKKRDEILLITYEMLHADAPKTLSSVITFLGINPEDEIILRSVEASSFDVMQKIESEKGLAGYEKAPENIEGRRVREGKVGNYRKYLSDEDIAYIFRTCDKNLNINAKKLLNSYSISYIG